jgi:hypothetical protein
MMRKGALPSALSFRDSCALLSSHPHGLKADLSVSALLCLGVHPVAFSFALLSVKSTSITSSRDEWV